jgi:hypothetical protein
MAGIAFADPIEPNQDTGGAVSFPIRYNQEEAGQTFVYGVPLQVAADGGIQIWSGTIGSNLIVGIASQNASNLGTLGAGAPIGFSPILGPGSTIGNYAANGNQTLAVITPPMTPISDGFSYYFVPGPTIVFIGKVGNGSTNQPVATAETQISKSFGLAKDTNTGYWFVDTNNTSTVAVQVVGFYPLDPLGTVGGHVLFSFLPAAVDTSV